jgi:hypothetical protein
MPQVLKFVTFFSEDDGFGWSEVHYKQVGEDEPNLKVYIDAFIASVVQARKQILGTGCDIVGMRVSYPKAGRTASFGARIKEGGDPTYKAASYPTSLAVNFIDSTYTRSKITHLRGFWDIVEEGSIYIPGAGGSPWVLRFNNWKDSLIIGEYGWLSKSAALSAQGKVFSYTSDADERVTFTIQGDPQISAAVGDVITVAFSKLNNSKSTLNRTLLVEVIDESTLKTTEPIATFPFTGQGRYSYRRTEFIRYNAIGSISVGERRMGAPLFRSPGRQSDRARG